MSVFRVKLQNMRQGLLDVDPATGTTFTTSKQRQIFVAGPKKSYRLLKDGEQFTDCNYWKRFAYPQMALEFAFIEVVSDDGSYYSDDPAENTFAKGATVTLTSSFADNAINFVDTYGVPAQMLRVQNLDSTNHIQGELNGDTNITFNLSENETQFFNSGDLAITQIRLKGVTGTPQACWMASLRSVPTS